MGSLYRVLGLTNTATAEQIEFGYRTALDHLKSENLANEVAGIRLKAVQEAYSILGSTARRTAYDAKFNAPVDAGYQTVESSSLPWKAIAFAAILLVAGSGYIFKVQQNTKMRLAEASALAQQAKAQADQAMADAEAESARLANVKAMAQLQADQVRNAEQRQARSDGQRIHFEQERFREHQQRMTAMQAQERQREERQAKYEMQREEQLARARVNNQNAAMQRALSIPIVRH